MPNASQYWKNPENRLRTIERASEWNRANKERRLEITRKSYKKNRVAANTATKKWRDHTENYGKVKDQRYKQYGMTYKDYLDLFKKQNGLCALCGEPPTEHLLSVDHDHTTNKVRGLLHRSCNSAIGILGDSVEGLERALKYLRENS